MSVPPPPNQWGPQPPTGGQPTSVPQWGPNYPWGPPPGLPPRGGKGKWIFGGIALIAVIAAVCWKIVCASLVPKYRVPELPAETGFPVNRYVAFGWVAVPVH